MEILNECESLLSNFEVHEHLVAQKRCREARFRMRKRHENIRELGPQNVLTIEFERYLETTASVGQSSLDLHACLTRLSAFKLTKSERLQMVNLLPQSVIELHTIIEECDERFSNEEVEQMLGIFVNHNKPQCE